MSVQSENKTRNFNLKTALRSFNCHHAGLAMDYLNEYTSRLNSFIIFGQEPYYYDGKIKNLNTHARYY